MCCYKSISPEAISMTREILTYVTIVANHRCAVVIIDQRSQGMAQRLVRRVAMCRLSMPARRWFEARATTLVARDQEAQTESKRHLSN